MKVFYLQKVLGRLYICVQGQIRYRNKEFFIREVVVLEEFVCVKFVIIFRLFINSCECLLDYHLNIYIFFLN